MDGVRHGLLAGTRGPDQQKRLLPRRFPRDRLPQHADGAAVAEQGTLHATARIAQQLFRDAQFALERRRAFRHADLERCVRRLQGNGRLRALFEELRVVDGNRNLIGHNRHEAPLMGAERPLHRTLDRKHTDQLVAREQWNRELTLGVRKPGHGRLAQFLTAPRFHHLAPLRRRVRTLLTEVARVERLPPLGHQADHTGAYLHATADTLVVVAAARDHTERRRRQARPAR